MLIWLIPLTLTALGIVGFIREPRRLRVGIALVAGISGILLGAVEFGFARLWDRDTDTATWFMLGTIQIAYFAAVILAFFLIYNGLVMLRRESARLPNMLSLFAGLGLLAYVGIGTFIIFTSNQTLFIWVFLATPPLAYLAFVFLAFIVYAWIYARKVNRDPDPVSAVIVLGAGLMGERVTPLLAGRLGKGKQVFEREDSGSPTALVVSGGQGADEAIPEAEAMGAWLADQGVPEMSILREDQSRTTYQNLLYSRRLLNEHDITGPIAVVTSNFHAFRAATLMHTLGIAGYAVGAPTARYYWPTATIREYVALLRDHLRLNVIIIGILAIPLGLFIILSIFRTLL